MKIQLLAALFIGMILASCEKEYACQCESSSDQ